MNTSDSTKANPSVLTIKRLVLILLVIVAFGVPGFGYEVELGWDPSVNSFDLVGYRVKVGNQSGIYDTIHSHELSEFADPDNPATIVSNLVQDYNYYFVVTAYTDYFTWEPYCMTLQAIDENGDPVTDSNGDPVYWTQQECQDMWVDAYGDLATIAESGPSNEIHYIEQTPLLIPVPPTDLNITAVFIEEQEPPPQVGVTYEPSTTFLPDGSLLFVLPDLGSGESVEFK